MNKTKTSSNEIQELKELIVKELIIMVRYKYKKGTILCKEEAGSTISISFRPYKNNVIEKVYDVMADEYRGMTSDKVAEMMLKDFKVEYDKETKQNSLDVCGSYFVGMLIAGCAYLLFQVLLYIFTKQISYRYIYMFIFLLLGRYIAEKKLAARRDNRKNNS